MNVPMAQSDVERCGTILAEDLFFRSVKEPFFSLIAGRAIYKMVDRGSNQFDVANFLNADTLD